jgi:hypothetical protein
LNVRFNNNNEQNDNNSQNYCSDNGNWQQDWNSMNSYNNQGNEGSVNTQENRILVEVNHWETTNNTTNNREGGWDQMRYYYDIHPEGKLRSSCEDARNTRQAILEREYCC